MLAQARRAYFVCLYQFSWLWLTGCVAAHTGGRAGQPELAALARSGQLRVTNRAVMPLIEAERQGLRFDARPLDGIAWLSDVAFTAGTIEFDVRGKDVLQRSFVGVAFHALNDSAYETVYFRPFNFRHADARRRSHAVQYESEPEYPWERLRKEYPGQYEAALQPAPAPNEWFHVRLVVRPPLLEAYVGEAAAPALRVTQLRPPRGSRLGLFVGDNSDGDFANLRITPAP
ncbi:hypothetical protein GCM10027048_30770 [Hymenobacter coalescens]